jgi:saccharopepsin
MPQVYTRSTGEDVTFCINTFVPLTIDALPFDFLLGDSFLRNVYAIYDFGDADTNGIMGKPYVKLLPLTDPTAASASFKKNRATTLAQLPAEGDISKLSGVTIPVPSNSKSSVSSHTSTGGSGSGKAGANLVTTTSDDDASIAATLNKLSTFAPIALALLTVNATLLVGLIAMGAFFLVRRSKAKGASVVGGSSPRGTYAPVTKLPEDDERSRTPSGRYDVPQYS